MPSEEILRVNRVANRKKMQRLDSVEGHVQNIAAFKANKAALEAEVAAFDAIIAGIVSEAKRNEINASALVVRIRAIYNKDVIGETARINGQRTTLAAINTLVQNDSDYTAAEKLEFQNAKDNEV